MIQAIKQISQGVKKLETPYLLTIEALSQQDLDDIFKCVEKSDQLEEINISGNVVHTITTRVIRNTLNINTSLTVLVLFRCSLCENSFIVIADIIKENKLLKKLNIADNYQVELEGLLAVVSSLQHNYTLEDLNLDGVGLSNDAIGDLYKCNLKTLILDQNPIFDIDDILLYNKTITDLSVWDCYEMEMKRVFNLLNFNTTLVKINVKTHVEEVIPNYVFANMFKTNKTLQSIIITGEQVEKGGLLSLIDALNINSRCVGKCIFGNKLPSEVQELIFRFAKELCF